LNHTSLKRTLKRHCLKKNAHVHRAARRASDSPSRLATTPIDGTLRSQHIQPLLRTLRPTG
jgi:hypothetical protein